MIASWRIMDIKCTRQKIYHSMNLEVAHIVLCLD